MSALAYTFCAIMVFYFNMSMRVTSRHLLPARSSNDVFAKAAQITKEEERVEPAMKHYQSKTGDKIEDKIRRDEKDDRESRSVDACDGKNVIVMEQESGYITSPNYPDPFSRNTTSYCYWKIIAPEQSIISLTFDRMHVYCYDAPCIGYKDCLSEKLLIFDSMTLRDEVYCADEDEDTSQNQIVSVPGIFNSSSNILYVAFIDFYSSSTENTYYNGFNLTWVSVSRTTTTAADSTVTGDPCDGGQELTEYSGEITSPNYPDSNYSSNSHCKYAITLPATIASITLNVTEFETEYYGSEDGCYHDYIRIFSNGKWTKPFCGASFSDQDYPPRNAEYQSNLVVVLFFSNGASNYKGFKIMYSSKQKPTQHSSTAASTIMTPADPPMFLDHGLTGPHRKRIPQKPAAAATEPYRVSRAATSWD